MNKNQAIEEAVRNNDFQDSLWNYVNGPGSSEAILLAALAAISETHDVTPRIVTKVNHEWAEKLEKENFSVTAKLEEAEEAFDSAYIHVTGKTPQWSDTFGKFAALQEIEATMLHLRSARTPDA